MYGGDSTSPSDGQSVFTVTFRAKRKVEDQSSISLTSTRTPMLAYAEVVEVVAGTTEGSAEATQVLGLTEAINPTRPTSYKLYLK